MNSESTHAKAYASVVGAFTFSGKMNSKPNLAYAAWKQHRSRGNVMCALHEMTNPKKRLFFKDEPSGSEVEALKLYAMALSEEDPERAVEIMRNECEYWKERKAERYLLMALIELLLSQWKYQEAKEDIEKLMEHIEKKGWAFDLPPEKVYFLKFYAMALSKEDPDGAEEIMRNACRWWAGTEAEGEIPRSEKNHSEPNGGYGRCAAEKSLFSQGYCRICN
ncbi:uncharacterized protein LOC129306617 isoform X2 [Prosopis cineraria]|uniref:uncharacterized protein LOC129306617 isoform X2 n=1 Tax=Prosopis cineraria TaxID=364024 RepID=UPI00240FEEA1|nr:uncharacterized protein LOC129306617 isoform X2 [Prosopis cineraria]